VVAVGIKHGDGVLKRLVSGVGYVRKHDEHIAAGS